MAERYRRAVEPAVRGAAGVVLTVVVFAVSGAAGGRAGAAIAGAWMTLAGLYCLANFWHCREAHCAVTGPGWTLAGSLALAAAIIQGGSLSWYRVSAQTAVFVVVLAVGYALEWAVARRVARRSVAPRTVEPEAGRAGSHAEGR